MQQKIDDKKLMRLIEAAKFPIHELDEMEKRRVGCIDDRAKEFPANRLAGGDFGQAAVIVAAANFIKSPVDPEAVISTISEYVGGEEKLHVHTDTHSPEDKPMGGCAYVQKVMESPNQFGITQEQAGDIFDVLANSQAEEAVLDGDHDGAAFLIVDSDKFALQSSHPKVKDVSQVFVYHERFVNERQDELASLLVERGVVQLLDGMTTEQFASILKQKAQQHFTLTKNKVAPYLPTRRVKISDDGRVKINLVS